MFLAFSPSKQIPHTSYLGLFWCSVSIQNGSVVKSELKIAVTFAGHGQRLLSAGLERAIKNAIMNADSSWFLRKRCDERLHFERVAFRHDSVEDWGGTGTPKE